MKIKHNEENKIYKSDSLNKEVIVPICCVNCKYNIDYKSKEIEDGFEDVSMPKCSLNFEYPNNTNKCEERTKVYVTKEGIKKSPFDDRSFYEKYCGKYWALVQWKVMMWHWSVGLSEEEIKNHPFCHPSNYY